MLVLSRKRNEQIMIGDEIVVTVVDVRGSCVRLGIKAPRKISVHRREVYDALQREDAQQREKSNDKPHENSPDLPPGTIPPCGTGTPAIDGPRQAES